MIAAELHTVYGIVNGTTNYILSRMYNEEGDYPDILAKAQELGYAEADPTADVGGADAAAKMAILASIAFHSRVTLADVAFSGIQDITLEDVRYAKSLGFVPKLIGAARLLDGKVSVRVFPALLAGGPSACLYQRVQQRHLPSGRRHRRDHAHGAGRWVECLRPRLW